MYACMTPRHASRTIPCPNSKLPSAHAPPHQSPTPPRPCCRAGKYDQVRINFANPDMVGHTGDLAATTACCALVDRCVKVRGGGSAEQGATGSVRGTADTAERSGERVCQLGDPPHGWLQHAGLHRPPAHPPCLTADLADSSSFGPSINPLLCQPSAPSTLYSTATGAAGGGGRGQGPLPGHLRPRQRRRHGAGAVPACLLPAGSLAAGSWLSSGWPQATPPALAGGPPLARAAMGFHSFFQRSIACSARSLPACTHRPPARLPQRDKKTKKPLVAEGKVVSLTSHTLAPGARRPAPPAGGCQAPMLPNARCRALPLAPPPPPTSRPPNNMHSTPTLLPTCARPAPPPPPAVPLAIGGSGLPEGVRLREDLPDAGLGNVAATMFNLMGFEARPLAWAWG